MASTGSNEMTFFCPPMSAAQQLAFWDGGTPPATDGLGITIRVDPATWYQQVQDALRGTTRPDDDGAAAQAKRVEQLMQVHQQLSSTDDDDPDGLAAAA